MISTSRPRATSPATRFCLAALLIACSVAMSGCVHLFPRSAAPKAKPPIDLQTPPRIEIPADYRRPARLDRLAIAAPTIADLEALARDRGNELALSETRRAGVVALHDAEHVLEDRWIAERRQRARPWWKFW